MLATPRLDSTAHESSPARTGAVQDGGGCGGEPDPISGRSSGSGAWPVIGLGGSMPLRRAASPPTAKGVAIKTRPALCSTVTFSDLSRANSGRRQAVAP